MSTNKKRGGEEAAAAPDPPDLSGDLAPWTLASVSHDDVVREAALANNDLRDMRANRIASIRGEAA